MECPVTRCKVAVDRSSTREIRGDLLAPKWRRCRGNTKRPKNSFEVGTLSQLATVFNPKRVLVVFAGVGQDMVEIDQACRGRCDIVGVEINAQMVQDALETQPKWFRDFFARSNIKLVVAEAREYLERDRSKYDAILLSWWGAGTSHYVGTAGALSEYLYTREALSIPGCSPK